MLKDALGRSIAEAQLQIGKRQTAFSVGEPGFYLEFQIPTTHSFVVDSLENARKGVELLSVVSDEANPKMVKAAVYVPESAIGLFPSKVDAYETKLTSQGNPRNRNLIDRIDNIRIADARSIFTEAQELFPTPGTSVWWEIWLRQSAYVNFLTLAERLAIPLSEYELVFPERVVRLAEATPETIEKVLINSDSVAELRLAKNAGVYVLDWPVQAQADQVRQLLKRVKLAPADAPYVCVLDTGANEGHPLLQNSLSSADVHTVNPSWGSSDKLGHGTQMCGLALLGDVGALLASQTPIVLSHRLESVKVLPNNPGQQNPVRFWGYLTADAVGRVEVQAATRRRVFCMAITSDATGIAGRPTSWSAELDKLSFGDGENQRLLVVAAGNIRDDYFRPQYQDRNDTEEIEDPAQSWNALSLGAFTEKVAITDPTMSGWTTVAPRGGLSPRSRTSLTWDTKHWPAKPDIVLEGGNYASQDDAQPVDCADELSLITTFHDIQTRLLVDFRDTSAATALAAQLAASTMSKYPSFWPETIRGLMVHGAEWTDAMLQSVDQSQAGRLALLRRYGYGVPSRDRVLWSASNSLTLVAQDSLRPYDKVGSSIKNRDLKLFKLPWPVDALTDLGHEIVEMRVTVSYFIEPNPGERGWSERHRYASHGLRFEVKRPLETDAQFHQRVNKAARDEEYAGATASGGDYWFLGSQLRNKGAVHSDKWEGTGADLASRGEVAVYPVGGWWKSRPHLNRWHRDVRFSLIISIRTAEDVDLYTPVQAQIEVPVET